MLYTLVTNESKLTKADKKAKKAIEQENKEAISTKTALFEIGGSDEKQ
nr:hypothetical protein [Mycoplasmopsis bovis]